MSGRGEEGVNLLSSLRVEDAGIGANGGTGRGRGCGLDWMNGSCAVMGLIHVSWARLWVNRHWGAVLWSHR